MYYYEKKSNIIYNINVNSNQKNYKLNNISKLNYKLHSAPVSDDKLNAGPFACKIVIPAVMGLYLFSHTGVWFAPVYLFCALRQWNFGDQSELRSVPRACERAKVLCAIL